MELQALHGPTRNLQQASTWKQTRAVSEWKSSQTGIERKFYNFFPSHLSLPRCLSFPLFHRQTDPHLPSLNTATDNGRSIWGSQLTSWPPTHFVDVTRMPNVKQKAVKDELGLKARLWAVIQSRRSLWGAICLPKKSCELLFSIRCIILRNHCTFQVKLV